MQYTLVGQNDGTANLTVYVEGEAPYVCHSSHPSWDEILNGVISGDESVISLFDIAKVAGTKFERLSERVSVSGGRLYFDGEQVHNALSEQVVRFVKEGVDDWKPLVAFWENLAANPETHSREQLYDWLGSEQFTITDTGMIVGYKGVGNDDRSVNSGTAIVNGEVYEGKIPNPVGAVVEMPRSEVHHNPSQGCSVGLHVGTHSYANGFAPKLLEVEVNPRDVVSVPNDSSAQKMRVCRYRVVRVIGDKAKVAAPVKAAEPVKDKKAKLKVRKGDVYQNTDARRSDTSFKVEFVGTNKYGEKVAVGKSLPLNITRAIKVDRLLSRKYRLVVQGKGK